MARKQPKPATQSKPKTEKVKCVAISARTDGFRRAGRPWGRTPEVVPVSKLTKAQLSALKADPEIFVVPAPDQTRVVSDATEVASEQTAVAPASDQTAAAPASDQTETAPAAEQPKA